MNRLDFIYSLREAATPGQCEKGASLLFDLDFWHNTFNWIFLPQISLTQVGHAGTLDPMATGLLIVCIGKATKLVERWIAIYIPNLNGVWEHIWLLIDIIFNFLFLGHLSYEYFLDKRSIFILRFYTLGLSLKISIFSCRYQGMIKGYSGIFRLGEATSTWDADSPVCLFCWE